MGNIKILDCTLRDGGYINEWDFGLEKAQNILELLNKSNIDYIETGFLTEEPTSITKTLFNSFDDIKRFIPFNIDKKKLFGMITYGKFPIENVPDVDNSVIKGIRLIFKKSQKDKALVYCKKLKSKGYKLFINPTFIDQFTDEELLDTIKEINCIHPYGMSIVDSMGVLKEKDLLRLYYLIDHNLDKNIALCFHSHNNLQLSFSNAQCLMKVCKDRELIIDSTVFGMGRGAGNLCTELITQYINDNYNGNYDIIPILKIVDEQINPIFARTPWGYSVPYYLAATNHCHPNYAKYLVDKQTVPVEFINNLLHSIPDNKKSTFDINLIKQLYLDKFSNAVDDSETVNYLEKMLKDRKILLLAPGKSLKDEKEKIDKFIDEEIPFIISLNFIPEDYSENMVFVTNMKRFSNLNVYSAPLIVSSNIENIPKHALVLNYSSYLNNSKMFDNVALMLLKLFVKIGVKSVAIAGLDGFSPVAADNYVSNELINNAKVNEFDERNEIMSEELEKFSEKIDINFITKTLYKIKAKAVL